MRRPLLVALALAVLGVLPAPAGAASVLTSDGLALTARDEGRDFCVELDTEQTGVDGASSCTDRPLSDPAEGAVTVQARSAGRRAAALAVGGAVGPTAATVEVVLADGRHLAAPTAGPGAYAGRQARRLRFFLLTVPTGSARPFYLRVLDAAGTPIAVADLTEGQGPPPEQRTDLGRLRAPSGRSIPLRAYRTATLAPTLAGLEHLDRELCVRLGGREPQCVDPAQAIGANVSDVSSGCGGTTITGVLRPGQRAVTAVLGDGRRVRALVRAIPSALTGGRTLRGYAVAVGPQVAVRRLEIPGSAPVLLRSAPGAAGCGGSFGSDSILYSFGPGSGRAARLAAPPQVAHTTPGGVPLRLADTQDGALCVRLDLRAPRQGDCRALERSPLAFETADLVGPAERTVAVVTGPGVDSVTVVLADGRRLPSAEVEAGAYAGAYAGHVRLWVARGSRGGGRLRGVVLRRAGRVLLDGAPRIRTAAPVRVLALPGGQDLWLHDTTLTSLDSAPTRFRCLTFSRGESSEPVDPCIDVTTAGPRFQQAFVRVDCATRRPVVLAVLPRGAAGATVELATGRRATARVLRLRGGVRLAVVVLGKGDRLRSVAVGRLAPTRIGLPAARTQCGYDVRA